MVQNLQEKMDAAASRLTAHLIRMANADFVSEGQYASDCAQSDRLTDAYETAQRNLRRAEKAVA